MFSEKNETEERQNGLTGRNIVFFESTDSTNVQAKRLAEEGAAHGTLVVADAQTAGRGRKGRQWQSPPGKNLYFSLLLREGIRPEKAPMLTLVMGISVQEAILKHCGVLTPIKWPNDIVLEDKKLAGILTELHFGENKTPYVIIGTGINIKPQAFMPELADKAIYLESKTAKEVSAQALLQTIMECFGANYALFLKTMDLSLLCEAYNDVLINRGKEVQVLDPAGAYSGMAEGINKEGELLVRLSDGSLQRVYAGEVSVRGIFGYV